MPASGASRAGRGGARLWWACRASSIGRCRSCPAASASAWRWRAAWRPNLGSLMLDEPLGSLDRTLRDQLVLDLRELFTSQGLTVVYVTHDQAEALALADQVAVIDAGRIAQHAPPADLWARPASPFVARFLGFSNLVPVRGARRRGAGRVRGHRSRRLRPMVRPPRSCARPLFASASDRSPTPSCAAPPLRATTPWWSWRHRTGPFSRSRSPARRLRSVRPSGSRSTRPGSSCSAE